MSSSKEKKCSAIFCKCLKCSEHKAEYRRKTDCIIEEAFSGNVDALRTLLDLSEWYKCRDECNTLPPALQSYVYHEVLHSAIGRLFRVISPEVAEVFIETGFDVNSQHSDGNTALHVCCNQSSYHNDIALKGPLMLLGFGADPMIRNSSGCTPLEMLIMREANFCHDYKERTPLPLLQHLFYLTFDEYVEWDIEALVLLSTTLLDPWIFEQTIKMNIREVVFGASLSEEHTIVLLTMNSHCLQVLIEKFDCLVEELLQHGLKNYTVTYTKVPRPILIENVEVLLNSKLKVEFIDWLQNNIEVIFDNILRRNTEPSFVQKFACLLFSHGVEFRENVLFRLFNFYCCRSDGYEMFKIFLYMDVEDASNNEWSLYGSQGILPRILYNITLDVPKMIEQRLLKPGCLLDLLPYFTVPSDLFADFSCWEEKLRKRPRVPLLIELARNVFRKYFIEKLPIKNARHFYTLIKLLPISAYHEAIITYEAKLYPDIYKYLL